MNTFKHISTADAKAMIEKAAVAIADIRDEASFRQSHLAHAYHLHNENLQQFLQQTDTTKPVIVYCYHGNSSQGAAQFLSNNGFDEVYSLDGGFEEWRTQYATVSE